MQYEKKVLSLRQFFAARGFNEIVSYSFVDPRVQTVLYPEATAAQLLNPMSSELSVMRVGLWPGLLSAMIYNAHRQHLGFQFVEQGVVFEAGAQGVAEKPMLAGLLSGVTGAYNWLEETRTFDFYDVKGVLQALFNSLKLSEILWHKVNHPGLHPGKSAQISHNGRVIGWCGVLHPAIAELLDIELEVILFELSLLELTDQKLVRYQHISKYPSIRRDLALLVDNHITAAEIEEIVRAVIIARCGTQSWLKSFDVFDIYCGESIPLGKKSLAISLLLQDDARTLVDEEVNPLIHAILKSLNEKLAVILRAV